MLLIDREMIYYFDLILIYFNNNKMDRNAVHGSTQIVATGLDIADDEVTCKEKLAKSLELARGFYINDLPKPVGFVPFSHQRPVQPNEKVFKVAPGLYIGSCYGASDVGLLRGLGMTHVINITSGIGLEPNFGEAFFKYTNFPVMDKIGEDVNKILDAMRFTADLYLRLKGEGGNIFVHCSAGLCRSASLVVAALMRAN